jgi:hypothetical protein
MMIAIIWYIPAQLMFVIVMVQATFCCSDVAFDADVGGYGDVRGGNTGNQWGGSGGDGVVYLNQLDVQTWTLQGRMCIPPLTTQDAGNGF